jgi:AbrB family looped-hinge helix DNA binding protein
MSKVTSKLQLTIPKAIADQYGIRPGDELEWIPAGDAIRVAPTRAGEKAARDLTLEEKLDLFDRNMARVDKIQAAELTKAAKSKTPSEDRGWTREELYTRGFPR